MYFCISYDSTNTGESKFVLGQVCMRVIGVGQVCIRVTSYEGE